MRVGLACKVGMPITHPSRDVKKEVEYSNRELRREHRARDTEFRYHQHRGNILKPCQLLFILQDATSEYFL